MLGLRCEDRFVRAYSAELEGIHRLSFKKSQYRGVIFGFTQSTQFIFWGILVSYGGYLVEHDLLKYTGVMT